MIEYFKDLNIGIQFLCSFIALCMSAGIIMGIADFVAKIFTEPTKGPGRFDQNESDL